LGELPSTSDSLDSTPGSCFVLLFLLRFRLFLVPAGVGNMLDMEDNEGTTPPPDAVEPKTEGGGRSGVA